MVELRCEELKNIVDGHFLIWSPTTFQGHTKHFQPNENWNKYPISLVMVDLPYKNKVTPEQAWQNEYFARNEGFGRVAKMLGPDDYVLLSDADEIPRAKKVWKSPESEFAICHMPLYYYWLNCRVNEDWKGTIRMPIHRLREMGGQAAFMHRNSLDGVYGISDGGWHFSYQGGAERIQNKLESFAHAEYNTQYHKAKIAAAISNKEDLFDRDKRFTIVTIDESYPKYIRDNLENYKEWICDQ